MDKIHFRHLESVDSKLTLAFSQIENESLQVSVALCGPTEQFCKKKGRMISSGRLTKGKKVLTVDNVADSHEFVRAFSKKMASLTRKQIKETFSL